MANNEFISNLTLNLSLKVFVTLGPDMLTRDLIGRRMYCSETLFHGINLMRRTCRLSELVSYPVV